MVQQEATFRAIDGTHHAHFEDGRIAVSMRNTGVPVMDEGHDFLHTGSPHAVLWVKEVSSTDLNAQALPVRHDARYAPGGTNVNLVALAGNGIAMRTFERGVEGETLSCGTGVTAAALVAAHRHGLTSPIDVHAPGGDLQVRFVAEPEGFAQIVLIGAVAEVYTGIVPRP
jgi:diaminopimelate epimerase